MSLYVYMYVNILFGGKTLEAISKMVGCVQGSASGGSICFKSGAYTSWLKATPTTKKPIDPSFFDFPAKDSGSGF